MRRRMLKLLSLALGALVALPANAQEPDPRACEYGPPEPPMDEPPIPAPEYGIQPPAPLPEPPPLPPVVLEGVVVRKVDGGTIAGIKVTIDGGEAVTDAQGRFAIALSGPQEAGAEITLTAEDVDGAAGGGRFATGVATVTLTDEGLAPAEDAVVALGRK